MAPPEVLQLVVTAVQTSESVRSLPLLIVGRTVERGNTALASVLETSLFDFDGYTSRATTQVRSAPTRVC